MTLFKNKYRIESTRLKRWDYASAGYYFVTICTRDRGCAFGDVLDGEMRLSPIGQIIAEEWQKTETIRPNMVLDEWVVMPNHLHGIIVIQHASVDVRVETSRRDVSTDRDVPTGRDVSTDRDVPTDDRGVPTKSRLKPHSVGSIIGQFKSVSTKRISAAGYPSFNWQERFYDHIIRNERALEKTRQYIVANPTKWDRDRNNKVHLWM